MTLEDKLKEIWCEKEGCPLGYCIDDAGLNQIIQAFKDDGWIQLNKPQKGVTHTKDSVIYDAFPLTMPKFLEEESDEN